MHASFANIISKAFRISAPSPAATTVICDFLAPTFRRPATPSCRIPKFSRPSSSRARHSKQRSTRTSFKVEPPYSKTSLSTDELQSDPVHWVKRIDQLLPAHATSSKQNTDADHHYQDAIADLTSTLVRAHLDHGVDVLSYMALQQGRWQTVVTLVKQLLEEIPPDTNVPESFEPFSNVTFGNGRSARCLDTLTEEPITAYIKRSDATLRHSLNELTETWNPTHYEHGARTRFLGVVWKSLGSMVLAAARSKGADSSIIMDHVLQILSYMHHLGVVPEAVYHDGAHRGGHALSQPPTLYILSSNILSSLSDAALKAREASDPKAGTEKGRYVLGYKIPQPKSRLTAGQLGPEIWLELILWSCLHGPWLLEGAQILEQVFSKGNEKPWSLISWRNVAAQFQSSSSTQEATLSQLKASFNARADPHSQNRALVERSLSSEVVAAYVDGLVDMASVGVGRRGLDARQIIRYISNFKSVLEKDNLGLGPASWNSILLRFLESEGTIIRKKPHLTFDIMSLALPFGQEVLFKNSPVQEIDGQTVPVYYLEPSAAPLGLLHEVLDVFVEHANTAGAVRTFTFLQEYTDKNKELAIKSFSQRLESQAYEDSGSIDFPLFFPMLPERTLANVFDLLTSSGLHEFGRWLLFAPEVDGPLIPPMLYANSLIAPAIIRFATATQDKDLLAKVMAIQSSFAQKTKAYIPLPVLYAFLEGQVSRRRWDSVENILQALGKLIRFGTLETSPFAHLAKELVLISHSSQGSRGYKQQRAEDLRRSQQLMGRYYFETYATIKRVVRRRLTIIAAVLCTVDKDLMDFCSHFFPSPETLPMTLLIDDFNTVLEGVLEAYGSVHAKRIVDIWCADVGAEKEGACEVLSGGVEQMPKNRLIRRPGGVSMVWGDDPDLESLNLPLKVLGKLVPNVATARLIVRKALDEQKGVATSDHMEILRWGELTMRSLGLDDDDISLEMGY